MMEYHTYIDTQTPNGSKEQIDEPNERPSVKRERERENDSQAASIDALTLSHLVGFGWLAISVQCCGISKMGAKMVVIIRSAAPPLCVGC